MRARHASRRAGWFLAASGILLAAAVTGGTLIGRGVPGGEPASTGAAGSRSSLGRADVFGRVKPQSSPTQSRPPAPRPAHRYVFPVAGAATYARDHHDYPAADVMAACGAPVRAATDGVVLEVDRADRYRAGVDDGATRGGLFVAILGDDGVRYYGSHLSSVAAGLAAGSRVQAGDQLGTVGDTGHADACHLHFGISPACSARSDWWIRRGVIWPWRYLDSWRTGGASSPAAETSAWLARHGCPSSP